MPDKCHPDGRPYHITICEFHREKVIQMVQDGHSIAAIAREIGTKRIRVREFLKRNSMKSAPQSPLLGDKNPQWKGGRRLNHDGYVEVYTPGHPNAHKHNYYILEHRLVMEKMIGRYLTKSEVVHHRDSNKANNLPENLQLFSENSEHLKHELTGKCPKWTPDGLERIRAAKPKVTQEQLVKLHAGHQRWRARQREHIHSS